MKSSRYAHPTCMKLLLVVCVLCVFRMCIAQDTLYMPVYGIGHEQFVLKNGGTFIYQSNLCGYRFISIGTYRKTLTGYALDVDTNKCPVPSIICEKTTFDTENILLLFYDFVDSTRIKYYGEISLAGKIYQNESDSLTINKSNLPNGSMLLRFEEGQEFLIDKSFSVVKVFLGSPEYTCGDNHVRTLRMTSRGYLYKEVVYDEDNEKSWKRRRRVVRHYFKKLS